MALKEESVIASGRTVPSQNSIAGCQDPYGALHLKDSSSELPKSQAGTRVRQKIFILRLAIRSGPVSPLS